MEGTAPPVVRAGGSDAHQVNDLFVLPHIMRPPVRRSLPVLNSRTHRALEGHAGRLTRSQHLPLPRNEWPRKNAVTVVSGAPVTARGSRLLRG